MARAHGFEDLNVWKLARELVRSIYVFTRKQAFGNDRALCDQLRRAAVSSMSNIAEGFERGSKRDFVRFLYMARGSAGEVRSHLYVAKDLDYITQVDFDELENQAVVLSKSLFRFIQDCESSAGCSKRLSSKAAASEEARRTLRYVESLSEARTKLADFFSILLNSRMFDCMSAWILVSLC